MIVGNPSVDVYCDMVTYNGGWTLFQRFDNNLANESRFQSLVEWMAPTSFGTSLGPNTEMGLEMELVMYFFIHII